MPNGSSRSATVTPLRTTMYSENHLRVHRQLTSVDTAEPEHGSTRRHPASSASSAKTNLNREQEKGGELQTRNQELDAGLQVSDAGPSRLPSDEPCRFPTWEAGQLGTFCPEERSCGCAPDGSHREAEAQAKDDTDHSMPPTESGHMHCGCLLV